MQKINLGPIRYWKNSLIMAQSIKKVGNAALEIRFKPGTFRRPNSKIFNQFFTISKAKLTPEKLSSESEKTLLGNEYLPSEGKQYLSWGIDYGLRRLHRDSRGGDKKITLANGILNHFEKEIGNDIERISMICSHIIIIQTYHHTDAIYEHVYVFNLSEETMQCITKGVF